MVAIGTYKEEYAEYKGKTVKILEQNYAKRTITIEYNGEIITVDYDDLFGMNKNNNDDVHSHSLKERIAELKERIKTNSAIFTAMLEKTKKIRRNMLSFLDNHHAENFRKLNESDRNTYLAMANEKTNCTKEKNKALFWILSDSNENLSNINNLSNWQSLQLLA